LVANDSILKTQSFHANVSGGLFRHGCSAALIEEMDVMLGRAVRGSGITTVLASAILHLGLTLPAMAQVKLEHKFVEGRKTVMHTTLKIKQTLTLGGMNVDTESDRFLITSAEAGQRDAEGKIRVMQSIDKLTTTLSLPGGLSLTFDSDTPDQKAENPALEPLLQLLRASVKAKTVFVHDPSGKVVSVEGLDKAAENLPEVLKGEFNAERARKAANQEMEILPTDPVKIGDTWTRNTELQLGSGQVMALTTEYKYLGEVQEGGKVLHKIESKPSSVEFSIAADSKLPLKVTKSELKPTDSVSTTLFDQDAGQVHSTKGKLHIAGILDLEINGTPLPGKLDLTIESETKRQP
jgi:hypothetical protein